MTIRNFVMIDAERNLTTQILKQSIHNMEYQHFRNIYIEILNKDVPMKQKYLRENQGRFMNKDLRQS